MKLAPWIAAVLLTGTFPAHGQDVAQKGEAERRLMTLERQWSAAIVKRDMAVIDALLADDYTLTTPEGRIATKAQVLKTFRSPGDTSFAIKNINLEEVGVRVFGDTALVSSRFTLKVEADGRNIETPFRHTDVFVKRQDHWRCVARQATRIRQSYGQDPATND